MWTLLNLLFFSFISLWQVRQEEFLTSELCSLVLYSLKKCRNKSTLPLRWASISPIAPGSEWQVMQEFRYGLNASSWLLSGHFMAVRAEIGTAGIDIAAIRKNKPAVTRIAANNNKSLRIRIIFLVAGKAIFRLFK